MVKNKLKVVLNELKLQKLQQITNENDTSQIIKTPDNYYIIFSKNSIFKTIKNEEAGLEIIEKYKNNKISLYDKTAFIGQSINDVKDEITNDEILEFYNGKYEKILKTKNDLLGVTPGLIEDLSTNKSALTETKKHVELIDNILYYQDDISNVLNNESINIAPGELNFLAAFINSGLPNIKDFNIKESLITKPDIMVYKDIKLYEDTVTFGKYTYRQYEITDANDNKTYIIYQISNSDSHNIKNIYTRSNPAYFFIENTLHVIENSFTSSSNDTSILDIDTEGIISEKIISGYSSVKYGNYIYTQYQVGEGFIVYQTGPDITDPIELLRADNIIIYDNIDGLGLIMCDYTRISKDESSLPVIYATTNGIVSNLENFSLSLVPDQGSWSYNSREYRVYCITTLNEQGNSTQWYRLYDITNSVISGIYTTDELIIHHLVTDIGMIVTNIKRLMLNDTSYTVYSIANNGTLKTISCSNVSYNAVDDWNFYQYYLYNSENSKGRYALFATSINRNNNMWKTPSYLKYDSSLCIHVSHTTTSGLYYAIYTRFSDDNTIVPVYYIKSTSTNSLQTKEATVTHISTVSIGSYNYRQFCFETLDDKGDTVKEYMFMKISTVDNTKINYEYRSDILIKHFYLSDLSCIFYAPITKFTSGTDVLIYKINSSNVTSETSMNCVSNDTLDNRYYYQYKLDNVVNDKTVYNYLLLQIYNSDITSSKIFNEPLYKVTTTRSHDDNYIIFIAKNALLTGVYNASSKLLFDKDGTEYSSLFTFNLQTSISSSPSNHIYRQVYLSSTSIGLYVYLTYKIKSDTIELVCDANNKMYHMNITDYGLVFGDIHAFLGVNNYGEIYLDRGNGPELLTVTILDRRNVGTDSSSNSIYVTTFKYVTPDGKTIKYLCYRSNETYVSHWLISDNSFYRFQPGSGEYYAVCPYTMITESGAGTMLAVSLKNADKTAYWVNGLTYEKYFSAGGYTFKEYSYTINSTKYYSIFQTNGTTDISILTCTSSLITQPQFWTHTKNNNTYVFLADGNSIVNGGTPTAYEVSVSDRTLKSVSGAISTYSHSHSCRWDHWHNITNRDKGSHTYTCYHRKTTYTGSYITVVFNKRTSANNSVSNSFGNFHWDCGCDYGSESSLLSSTCPSYSQTNQCLITIS